jgi:hypothetical protein
MIRRILYGFVWVTFLICTLEVLSRLFFFPQYTAMLPGMYVPHPILGHYNRPGVQVRRYNPMNYDVINTINSLGMRGHERYLERELAGIWICGASNTFGGYVEDDEVFSAGLRKYDIWAANLASESHWPDKQVLVIRYLAAAGYKPRAVILTLSMFNAIQDYSDRYGAFTDPLSEDAFSEQPTGINDSSRMTAQDKLRRSVDEFRAAIPMSFQSIRARTLKSSALYGWLKVGITGVPALRSLTLRAGLRNDLDLVGNFDLNMLRPMGSDNPIRASIESTANYMAAIQKLVREKFNVPFGVIILPHHLQLHPANFQRFLDHFGYQAEDLNLRPPSEELSRALRGRGIPVLDAFPALAKSGLRRMTFPDDGHLNSAAHGVVAKAAADWIDLRILPKQPSRTLP